MYKKYRLSFLFGLGLLAVSGLSVGCAKHANDPVSPAISSGAGSPVVAIPKPSVTQLVGTRQAVVPNGHQVLIPTPSLASVPGYNVRLDLVSVGAINNHFDDNQLWDVVGHSASVQAGNAASSITFNHTLIQLPAGSIVRQASMALHAQESDIRTFDLPEGYRGWALVSAGRSYLPATANDFSFSSTTARVGHTLIALAATGWGFASSTVVCDVYFVGVPDSSSFELIAQQPLVMHNGVTATALAPVGSFTLWQEYTASVSELSASILSSELQKKIKEVVPDNFVTTGAPDGEVVVSAASITPAQIGVIISWGKQLWNLGVLVIKFFSSNPRDNDVSFLVSRTSTTWLGAGVDGNTESRAIMQIYQVKP